LSIGSDVDCVFSAPNPTAPVARGIRRVVMLGRLAPMSKLALAIVDALRKRYQLEVGFAEPLLGGYDVWAESWRVESDRGPLVVRADRSISLLAASWLADVMRRAAEAGVSCCLPLSSSDGAEAFSTGDATVTVRAFVQGCDLDRDDPDQLHAAGAILGLLHATSAAALSARPSPSPWAACFWPADHDPSTLHDPELDAWHEGFTYGGDRRFARGVVHGDFWAGNLLWADGRVAAVIDWSEARVDVLARELAWATWEFGHDETSRELDIDRARTFLAGFRAVSGSWEPGLGDVLVPLMRVELRLNARYSLADPEDVEYNSALQRAFVKLRRQSAAPLLDL